MVRGIVLDSTRLTLWDCVACIIINQSNSSQPRRLTDSVKLTDMLNLFAHIYLLAAAVLAFLGDFSDSLDACLLVPAAFLGDLFAFALLAGLSSLVVLALAALLTGFSFEAFALLTGLSSSLSVSALAALLAGFAFAALGFVAAFLAGFSSDLAVVAFFSLVAFLAGFSSTSSSTSSA